MNDYERLKAFWNKELGEPEKAESWIENEKFNQIINDYLRDGDYVLDFGAGSGWGLTELTFKKKINGIGIDTAINSINYANKMAQISNLDNIKFICADESILDNYIDKFDFVLSVNLLDVLPDEIVDNILEQLHKACKKGAYLFIGLNPDFTVEQLTQMIGMKQVGHYFYKDDILRANKKTKNEWANLFSNNFEVIENFEFVVDEREKDYPRNGYLLKSK